MPLGIQSQVGVQPAIAFAGDYSDNNPRAFVNAGPGGLVSGKSGLIVGRFAWLSAALVDPENAAIIANNFGLGAPAGLVTRRQQGLNTTFLSHASMAIPGGFPIELMSNGGLWVKNDSAVRALVGQKAFADYSSGMVSFGDAGVAKTISATVSSVAAATFSATGSITGNVLTVTAVGAGTLYPGATFSGTGVATGTKILEQLTGTPGGIGTYAVSIPDQLVASTALSGTYGVLTVGTTSATTWGAGQVISGAGVVAGTRITARITGLGGAGTYVVDNNTVVASATITASTAFETKFVAQSSGDAGELVKISSWLQG
jgi:hypothetical protein